MDEEDARPAATILKQLVSEELDQFSQDDLQDRIAVLQKEIKRSEEAIENKKSSRMSAEKFFR